VSKARENPLAGRDRPKDGSWTNHGFLAPLVKLSFATTPPMGALCVKSAWWSGPVTCGRRAGWVPVLLAFLAAAGVLCRRAAVVKLERPQPRSGEDERA